MAGFVGTSNLLTGDAAAGGAGPATAPFGIRPEKLAVAVPGGQRPLEASAARAPGTLTEVVYAGPVTRYVVDLDAGPRLIALAAERDPATAEALDRGARVDLVWDARPRHRRPRLAVRSHWRP